MQEHAHAKQAAPKEVPVPPSSSSSLYCSVMAVITAMAASLVFLMFNKKTDGFYSSSSSSSSSGFAPASMHCDIMNRPERWLNPYTNPDLGPKVEEVGLTGGGLSTIVLLI